MRKYDVLTLLIIGAIAGPSGGGTSAADAGQPNASPHAREVMTVLQLHPDDQPEGIAFDGPDRLFVGNRRLDRDAKVSEILSVSRSGAVSVFATLEAAGDPSAEGVLGLGVHPRGGLYAAIVSFDPAVHGVWRLDLDGGGRQRLPGSELVAFPNALAFDPRGNLYVTDSVAGGIWRFSGERPAVMWVQHQLLAPGDPVAPELPPIGANGIAFVPPDNLFVANTERGAVVRVRIGVDGRAGTPELVVRDFALASIDGLAADVHGNLHGVIPGFALFGTHPLVRIDPETAVIDRTMVDPAAFHFPLSLAFGAGAWDPQSVYVTNGGPLFPLPGPGPGVVRAHVGIPGRH